MHWLTGARLVHVGGYLMTVDHPHSSVSRAPATIDILLDGLFTGMIGALAVAVWFLVLDVAAGRPLYTPNVLGNVLLHGSAGALTDASLNPVSVAAYTAFHFLVFIVIGVTLAYLMSLFERFPIMFFVLLVLFLCLQMGFFVINLALGAELLGRLPIWSVVVANLLAAVGMALYQWKRHPSVIRSVESLWEDDEDRTTHGAPGR